MTGQERRDGVIKTQRKTSIKVDLKGYHSVERHLQFQLSPINTMQYTVDGEMHVLKSKTPEATLNAVRISFLRFSFGSRKCVTNVCWAPNVCASQTQTHGDHCNCVPKNNPQATEERECVKGKDFF